MKLLDFQEQLQEAIYESEDFEPVVKHISTFEEQGLLTNNKGLVVELADGSEYELTIVPSNAKANEEDEEDEDD